MNLIEERKWVAEELSQVADFWLKNGMDKVHGGVYTCIDKDGKVFSTDKSVWMQGRAAWTFSYLCRVLQNLSWRASASWERMWVLLPLLAQPWQGLCPWRGA